MKSAKITHTIVLVLDETNTLSFAAAVDPLRAANRQAGRTVFEWQFATPTDQDVRLTSGLSVAANPLHKIMNCDLLIVVAGFNLDMQTTPQLRASLRRLAARADQVAGVDGGPWVMAQSGILDGHLATMHWEDLDRFRKRFDRVTTLDARFVDSGTRLTSGGAAPALEMMLHLISQRYGAALSDRVAGGFIFDEARPAARPQIRQSPLRGHSAITARAQDLMQTHLEDPICVKGIARRLGISLRGLQLQFRTRLGTTPQSHYLALRLAEADRLVTQTALPLQDVALITGFNSQSSFARAYRQKFGISARRRRSELATPNTTFNMASDVGDAPRQFPPIPLRSE